VGLISDTHGLLRPEALSFLQGCLLIVHAGDIGGRDILDALSAIAPVIAVRGNNDTESGMQSVNESEYARIGDVLLYVVHDRAAIDKYPQDPLHPLALGVGVVVTGHSHKPLLEHQNGVLFVNPGSAGRRRFTLPIAIGELRIDFGRVAAKIVNVMDGSVIAAG
jgi:putative phosphoesterase